jgi:uncharacterized protein (DUF2236 family)
VIETLRTWLGGNIRGLLAGTRQAPERRFDASEPGLFGPGSATWAVHGDVAGLVGGVRALLVQALHPLAMAGVADHSDYRSDPLGRLHRTAGFIATTTFGSTADAEAAIARVRSVHERVIGTAPDGREYHATDPHLLSWVHCTEIDSFLRARQRYGTSPLPTGFDDRYVDEMAEIGRRLGVEHPPTDVAGLEARLWAFRPELAVNHQARETVRFLSWPPLPMAARAPYGLVLGAAIGLVPAFARRMLRLPLPPLLEPVAIRPAATILLRTIGWALDTGPALETRQQEDHAAV